MPTAAGMIWPHELAAGKIEHIALDGWGDLLLMAPATADLLGRLAAGLGGDVLTVTALAWSGPVLIAPAMNDRMWANPIVQANRRRLEQVASHRFIEPASGRLACGSVGCGRMSEPETIIERVEAVLEES